jgi:hypothetical protein
VTQAVKQPPTNRRIEQALQEFFTHEQIPFPDRQAYIDQAREISATVGPDHCLQWLQPYAEDARTRHTEWSRARVTAAAIINSRHQPQAKPDGLSALAMGNPGPTTTQASAIDLNKHRAAHHHDNAYAAAKAGRPHLPVQQEEKQPTLL